MCLSETDSVMWHKSDPSKSVPIHLIRNSYHFPAQTCDTRQGAIKLWEKQHGDRPMPVNRCAPIAADENQDADGNVMPESGTSSSSASPSTQVQENSANANSVGQPPGRGPEGSAQGYAPAAQVEIEAVERGIPADLGPGAPVDRMREHLRDKLGGSTSGTQKELWDRVMKLDNERKSED